MVEVSLRKPTVQKRRVSRCHRSSSRQPWMATIMVGFADENAQSAGRFAKWIKRRKEIIRNDFDPYFQPSLT